MADATLKRLLVKLGLNASEWESAVKKIKSQLDDLNKQETQKHQARLAQASKEIAAEKDKASQIQQTVKHIEAQINGYKGVLSQQTLSNEQSQKAVKTAQNLIKEQQLYLNILKQMPGLHDLDLQKMQQKLSIAKQEFALEQNRLRLAAGQAMKPAGPAYGPQNLSKLQGQLERSQLQTAMTTVQAEMQANDLALRQGSLKYEEYAKKQEMLMGQVHKYRMDVIAKEHQAILNQIRDEESLGKVSTTEAKLRAQVAEEQAKRRMIAEEQANKAAMVGLRMGAPKGESLMGKVTEIAGFMLGGGLPIEMMAAVTAGNALEKVLEKIGEKLREVFLGTDVEQRLAEQFDALARGSGQDAVAMITKLREATHGLVDDLDIYRTANTLMQSGIKISTDKLAELTEATVQLARANGHDATQAVQALNQSFLTGRAYVLAQVTGIDRYTLGMRGFGSATAAATRAQLSLDQASKVIVERYQQVGAPVLTLAENLQRVSIASKNFYSDIAISISKSPEFRAMVLKLADGVSTLVTWFEKASQNTAGLGSAFGLLGAVLEAVKSGFTVGFQAMKTFVDLVVAAWTPIGKLVNALGLGGLLGWLGKLLSPLASFRGIMGLVAQVAVLASAGLERASLSMSAFGTIAKDLATGDLKAAKSALDEYRTAVDRLDTDTLNRLGLLQARIEGRTTTDSGRTAAGGGSSYDLQTLQKIQQAKMAYILAANKEQLAMTKARIEEEKQMTEDEYKDGLTTIDNYIERRKDQEMKLSAAKIREIQLDRQTRLQELQQQAVEEGMVPEIVAYKRKQIEATTNAAIAQERMALGERLAALDKQSDVDSLAAHRKYIDAVRGLSKMLLDDQAKDTEKDLKEGVATADEYLAQRRRQIKAEYDATVDALNEKYKYEVKTKESEAQLSVDLFNARVKMEKDLTDLTKNELDTRLEAIDTRYKQTSDYLQSVSGVVSAVNGGPGMQISVIGAQQDANDRRIKELHDQLASLNPLADDYLQNWTKISTEINRAYQEHVKLNKEMVAAKDLLTPIATIFGAVATSFGNFSKTLQDSLQRTATLFQAIAKYRQDTASTAGATGNPLKDMVHFGRSLFSHKRISTGAMPALDPVQAAAVKFGQTVTSTSQLLGSTFTQAVQTATAALTKMAGTSSGMTVSATGGLVPTISSALPWTLQHTGEGINLGTRPNMTGPLGDFNKAVMHSTGLLGGKDGKSGGLNEKLAGFAKTVGAGLQAVGGVINSMTSPVGGAQGAFSGAMSGMSLGMMAGPIGAAVGGVAGAVFGGIFGSKRAEVEKQITQINRAADNITKSLATGTERLGDAITQLIALKEVAQQHAATSKKKAKQSWLQEVDQLDQQITQLEVQQQKTLLDLHTQLAVLASPQPYQDAINNLNQLMQKYKDYVSAAAGNATELANANQFLVLSLQQYVTTQQNQLRSAEIEAIQNALQLNDLLQQRQQLLANTQYQEYQIMTQGVLVRQPTVAMSKAQQIAQIEYDKNQQLLQLNAQIDVAQHRYDIEQKIFNLGSDRVTLEQQLVVAQNAQTDYQMAAIKAQEDLLNKLGSINLSTMQNLPALLSLLGFTAAFGYAATAPGPVSPYDYLGNPITGTTNPGTPYAGGPTVTVGPYGETLPSHADGGYIGSTGPAYLHRGEVVIPADMVARAASVGSSTSAARLSTEARISSMVTSRAAIEMQVISARKSLADSDAEHMRQLRGLIGDLQASGGVTGTADVESLITTLYNTRGRYGAGGFYREYL